MVNAMVASSSSVGRSGMLHSYLLIISRCVKNIDNIISRCVKNSDNLIYEVMQLYVFMNTHVLIIILSLHAYDFT